MTGGSGDMSAIKTSLQVPQRMEASRGGGTRDMEGSGVGRFYKIGFVFLS